MAIQTQNVSGTGQGSPLVPDVHNVRENVREIRDFRDQRAVELQSASISWRAIFAGAFITMLVYLILTSLGVAIGSSTLRGVIQGNSGAGALSVASGVWLVVTALISLFVGGYFAGRVGGIISTRIGRAQGLVISALFFAFILTQLGAAIGLLGSGVGSAVSGVAGAAGDISKNPQIQQTINRAMGGLKLKSPPNQVAQGIGTRLLQGDANGAKVYLANQAGISSQEADRRIASLQNDVQSTVKDVGGKAAGVASTAAWSLFGALILGSAAAMLGGGLGANQNLRG